MAIVAIRLVAKHKRRRPRSHPPPLRLCVQHPERERHARTGVDAPRNSVPPRRSVPSKDEQVTRPKLPPPLVTIRAQQVEAPARAERDRDEGCSWGAPAVTMPADVRGAIRVVRDEALVHLDANNCLNLVAQSHERRRPVTAGQRGRWIAVGLPDVGDEAGRGEDPAIAAQHHRRDGDLAENLRHHLGVVGEPTGVVDRPSVRAKGFTSEHLQWYPRVPEVDASAMPVASLSTP